MHITKNVNEIAAILKQFHNYCINLNLEEKTIRDLRRYANDFGDFLEIENVSSFSKLDYKQLVNFSISKQAGPHTVKLRIWMIKKLFAFLHLKQLVKANISSGLNPPKIPKNETNFLSENELLIVLNIAAQNINETNGFRDFIIILLMAVLGFRKSTVVALDYEDFDYDNNRLFILEKGNPYKKAVCITLAVSRLLSEFIYRYEINSGPLFYGKKKQRLKPDAVNKIVNKLKGVLIEKGYQFAEKLHPHIFRHSAATQINEIAGLSVTKEFMGHRNVKNTKKYIHLSPTAYGDYMLRHPYFAKPMVMLPKKEF